MPAKKKQAKKVNNAQKPKTKVKATKVAVKTVKPLEKTTVTAANTTTFRVPIVAVMGHVDHGKTTLLDTIRGTRVQANEYGGITQNTRAHKVEYKPGKFITFIDTPGHEAFSEMRSRGAQVADIVCLVVAADDGVQPQTKESIKFIKSVNLPVIVVCTKIDVAGVNLEKIKQELSSNGILIEEYGGDALFMPVSSTKNIGIKELLDAIELVAEVHELKTQTATQGVADGFVLESNLDKDLGPVALILVKSGEVTKGQYLVSRGIVHKVRATLNEAQKQVEKGEQGEPVWIIGLKEVLKAGEQLSFFDNSEVADELAKKYHEIQQESKETLKEQLEDDNEAFAQLIGAKTELADHEKTLSVILKTDTQGTLEAITNQIALLTFADAKVKVFSASTGAIGEADVEMAKNIKGIVLGFQVKTDDRAASLAKRDRVLVRSYQLIYDLIDEVSEVVQSMADPEEQIVEVARARVKQVIKLTNGKYVAGCEVVKGLVIKGYKVFVDRKGENIGESRITSLKYQKDDIKEAKKGTECGIMLEAQLDIQTGDDIVCFKTEYT